MDRRWVNRKERGRENICFPVEEGRPSVSAIRRLAETEAEGRWKTVGFQDGSIAERPVSRSYYKTTILVVL